MFCGGVVLRWIAHDIHQASLLAGGGSRLFQGDILLIHLNFAFHLCMINFSSVSYSTFHLCWSTFHLCVINFLSMWSTFYLCDQLCGRPVVHFSELQQQELPCKQNWCLQLLLTFSKGFVFIFFGCSTLPHWFFPSPAAIWGLLGKVRNWKSWIRKPGRL